MHKFLTNNRVIVDQTQYPYKIVMIQAGIQSLTLPYLVSKKIDVSFIAVLPIT